MLNKAAAGVSPSFARRIYHSLGTLFGNRVITDTPSMGLISMFVLLHAVGLGAMIWYINLVPAWTCGLNAMALAGTGKATGDAELPPI